MKRDIRRRWQTLVLCLITQIWVLLTCTYAYADDNQTKKLVTGESYFPYLSNRLPHGGWSRAIVDAVFAKLSQDVQTDVLPWARGYQWTLENKYHGTFPYIYTEQRNRDFLFSAPINQVPIRLYVSKSTEFTTLASLNKKRLCLPNGYTIDAKLQRVFENLSVTVQHAKNPDLCIRQVMAGWSDFGLINGYFMEQEVVSKFGSLNGIQIIDEDLGNVSLHFIIPRSLPKAQQQMREFNAALLALEQDGQKQKIDEQFMQILHPRGSK